ncbi:6-phosphogluconolactonase [Planctomycetes bacterium K23_9]|uniref:6-phosphogluconolactonase n=1 Tax=Stieleria marina TaxID=1930275 RepID=A0A517P1N4_9BACT|nr:6-phosphogluconolactonase [Planctomycetes bacterium K23_9]
MLDDIKPFPNLLNLHQTVVDAFCELAESTISTTGRFRVSLSGGSTPKRIYEMLAQRDLSWQHIHWFWGDERNVPHDHRDSNFLMVRKALLDHVPVPEANVHPVPVNVDDPKAAAQQYEATLRTYFEGDTFPQWDLALLGMGDDAHTASLFPQTDALNESERWFVENWVEKFDAFRYTLTAPAINSAAQSWFLIAGENKQDALAKVFSNQHEPQLYPSQLVTPSRWFICADAIA